VVECCLCKENGFICFGSEEDEDTVLDCAAVVTIEFTLFYGVLGVKTMVLTYL